MNLQEYIQSGILESYALGELGEQESHDVESKIAAHPELRAELHSIELAMESLVTIGSRAPGQNVKRSLSLSLTTSVKGTVVPIRAVPLIMIWKYATAASLLLAVATSVLAYVFWTNWKRTETDLAESISLSQRMTEDFNTVNERLDKIEKDLNVYDNPLFQKVIMKGTAEAPTSMASVYWNRNTREVFLSLQSMNDPGKDYQFQLWAIVNGRPVDLGVFDKHGGGLSKMNDVSGASAFAVTIEPRGGKSSPTMETLQVMGST